MIKKPLLTVAALGLLSACGSDDKQDFINSYSPSNQSTNIDVDTAISIGLSGALNTSSLDVDQITLVSSITGKAIEGDLTYNSATKEIVFQPDHKLAVNTQYNVTLAAGLSGETDQETNELSWSFTTNDNYRFELMGLEENCADNCGNELWLIAETVKYVKLPTLILQEAAIQARVLFNTRACFSCLPMMVPMGVNYG